MNKVICLTRTAFQLVSASDFIQGMIREEDVLDYMCPGCHQRAWPIHLKPDELCFGAHHEPDCPIPDPSSRHRVHQVNIDTLIDDVSIMLQHEDGPPCPHKPKPGPPGIIIDPPIKKPDTDEYDQILKYGIKVIHRTSTLVNYARLHGRDADIGGGRTAKDIIMNEEDFRISRSKKFQGPKIVKLQRLFKSNLKHKIIVPPGYILLRDAYANNVENAIFFLVRLKNEAQNTLFHDKITGRSDDPDIKDQHRYIDVLGDWEVYGNDYYHVYTVRYPVNSFCINFTNRPD